MTMGGAMQMDESGSDSAPEEREEAIRRLTCDNLRLRFELAEARRVAAREANFSTFQRELRMLRGRGATLVYFGKAPADTFIEGLREYYGLRLAAPVAHAMLDLNTLELADEDRELIRVTLDRTRWS